jgi:hypothetical protein
VASFPRSAEEVGRTFGYHLMAADVCPLLEVVRFSRLLVVNRGVPDVIALAGEVRTTPDEVDLPSGLHWFSGLESTIAMAVTSNCGTSDGVAVALDAISDEDPLRAAYDWAEHLWEVDEVVPFPAFRVGDSVIVRGQGRDSEVRSRKFVAGTWTYEVRLDGRSQQVLESALESVPESGEPADWIRSEPSSVDRFGATLTRGKLDASLTDTVFSFRATRTVFRPYQFKPLLRLLHTGATRIHVADEVGLGKTIEAGLIWTEFEARHAADRVRRRCACSRTGSNGRRPGRTSPWSCAAYWAWPCSTSAVTVVQRRSSTAPAGSTGRSDSRRPTHASWSAPTTPATPTPRLASRRARWLTCGSTCRTSRTTMPRTPNRHWRADLSSRRCSPRMNRPDEALAELDRMYPAFRIVYGDGSTHVRNLERQRDRLRAM